MKHIYREGDRIRILRTRIISRVGYDLIPAMLHDEAEAIINLAATQMMLGLKYHHTSHRIVERLTSALAFAMVADRGFGSNERKLHYKKVVPFMQAHTGDCINPHDGDITQVTGKYICHTGTRYPSSSYQNYEGEWNYESGGLSNRQTHVILKTPYGDIETCDVEPYKE